jgi:hypothetical protein
MMVMMMMAEVLMVVKEALIDTQKNEELNKQAAPRAVNHQTAEASSGFSTASADSRHARPF